MACYVRPHAIPSRQHNRGQDFTPFNPLLSFLEDFATQFQPDNTTTSPAHSKQRAAPSSAKKNEKMTPSYTPRFDIIESNDAYELYGELPGVASSDLSVEFSDEKTLVISGSSARTASSATVATTTITATSTPASVEATTETTSLKGKEKQAAVEDADDFEDLSTTSRAATPDSTTAPDPESQSPEELDTATSQPQQPKPAEPEQKFLLSERKYGTFERTFQFQAPVEKEDVSARLRDGVLVVKVPKKVIRHQKVWVSVE